MWTPTPLLLGRRTPRPGLARVCVRAPLGRVGRAGLLGAFWCASPSPVAALCALFVCSAPSGLGLPCLWLFSVFCLVAPPLSLSFRVFQPGLPLALASCGPPAPPPPFFSFCPYPLSPPRLFFFFPLAFCIFAAPLFCFFVCLGVPVLRCLSWYVCPALWGVLVCVAVGLVPRRGPCCACAVSFVAPWLCLFRVCCCLSCGGVVVFCFLPGAVWRACVGRGSFPVLLPPVAVAWSPVVARACALPWGAVLRCSGGRLSCGVVLSASCLAGGAVFFCSRRLVLCVVACGCRLFVAGSGCLPLFSAGVCCRGFSCLAAWPAALLCAVVCCGARSPVVCPVFCGAVLPCGAVLCCPAVRSPLLVVLVWVLSLCVRCCVALRVVLFGAGSVCAVVGASCCGVSLCVLVYPFPLCGLAVLLWGVVVSCCAVLCSVVLCRLLVPCCWGVLCVVLCCGCSFCL